MRYAKITAVILTKNEEADLPRCIKSLQWCSGVVIVDSGSHDKTIDIAQQLGGKTFTNVQNGKFLISEQRNWAIAHTGIQTEWILFVDADETISQELAEAIIQFCETDGNQYDVVELAPKFLFWGKWLKRTQGFPCWHPRIVKRGAVWFEGGVWEHVPSSASVFRIWIPYDHYANSKGLKEWLSKHERYADWDAEQIISFQHNGFKEFRGGRKPILRSLSARFWIIRPFTRFIYLYIFRFGFTEGFQGLFFSLLYAVYEFFVIVKVIEKKRLSRGDPL